MTRFASAAPATRAAVLTAGAVCTVALWIVMTFMVALAGLHRLSPQLDATAVPGWFWYYRADAQVLRWLKVGALGSLIVLSVAAVGAVTSRRRPLHGAARFAREHEVRREGLRAEDGVLLGLKDGRPLVFGGTEHVLLYAPTRTGKGVGVVIPVLLTWPHSAVVLDIKGENFAVTSGYRAAHGQRVLVIDPFAAEGQTTRYNPLSYIDRTDPVLTIDELQKIAAMLFPATGERSDPFWAEAARTGFVGVGAYVAETPGLPFTLGQIFRELTKGSPRARFPQAILERARARRPLSSGCVSALTDFCAASENTFASIRQTITSRMGLWLNPRVDWATSTSDVDLRALREQKVTIYLTTSPDNISRVAPLYNLFFQQLVDLNTREPPPTDQAGKVLLLMDEFARLGHAGVIAQGFSFVAGYGLRILAVLQSPSQLRAQYGPDLADEIIANCGVELAFTPKELKLAQELSDRLGYYTYGGRSRSRPLGFSSGKRSQTESDQRRALMLPQELLQMPRHQLLVLRAGIPPVRGKKLVYYRDRTLRDRLLPSPVLGAPETPPGGEPNGPGRLLAEVAAIRTVVEDIRVRLSVRPMTAAEAAGEALLSEEQISLALEDVDLGALTAGAMSEDEVRAISAEYVARSSLPPAMPEFSAASSQRSPRPALTADGRPDRLTRSPPHG